MDEQAILNALALGEERDWEFKSAKGGIAHEDSRGRG